MSNSSMVSVVGYSPFTNGERRYVIDRITPHCIVGEFECERLPQFFDDEECSCNYAIAKDGRVALIVDEDKNSWCSSNQSNDQRAVTIECSSAVNQPYRFNDSVYNSLIDLCVDICVRNNMTHIIYIDDYVEAAKYDPPVGECQLTLHRMFSNKACPGDWFVSKIPDFLNRVNHKLAQAHGIETRGEWHLQIGAFQTTKYAEDMANKANASGLLKIPAKIEHNPVTSLYEVSCGHYDTREEAAELIEKLKHAGFSCYMKKCQN